MSSLAKAPNNPGKPAPIKKIPSKISQEINFYDHQIEGIRWLAGRKSWLLGDEQGLGKLAPLSEPILTPSGWRPMGEIGVGDQVIGRDGKPTLVVAIYPQGRKEIFKVSFNDGSWTRCGKEHLWQVQTRVGSQTRPFVLTTAQLMDPDGEVEWYYDGPGAGVRRTYCQKTYYLTSQGYGRWGIPLVDPVQFDDPGPLPIDPYSLGAWLGDGHTSGVNVGFTSLTDVDWFSLNIDGFLRGSGKAHRLGGWFDRLRELGLQGKKAWEKFVPEIYLRASEHDRRMLLAGLMDTDGTASGKHSTEFSTTSPMLRDAVVELVQSLGGVARVREKAQPSYDYLGEKLVGRPAYRVNMKLRPGENPFCLPRKADAYDPPSKYPPARRIVSIEPDGFEEAQCVKVDASDSLYVTRNYIVTHNTIQALTVAALDFDRGWATRILVIAGTKQLKYQWADEIAKLTHFSCLILDGTPKQRDDQLLKFARGGIDILIVNYEQLAKHCKAFNFLGFQIIIVDECHEVKNADAQRTKAIHQLKADRWFLLSGTPILNRPDELWSPLKLIDPNTPTYDQWVNKHCLYSTRERKVVGVKKKGELKAYLETVMLRRLKRDCLDLPDKQYIRVNIELSPYQRQVYVEYQEELWEKLPAAPNGVQRQQGLAQALRLRQICSTPFNVGLEDDSAKLDEAEERVAQLMENDHKVVCFTQFRGTLECMERRLERRGIKAWPLHGDIKGTHRNEFVREWTQSSDPGVLLCMFQVAGVGLNLTAARHAMMIDKLYVPGKMDQAEDRVHRIGQDTVQPVQIIELIARRSYEEKVERILNDKGAMIDTLVPNSGWDQKMYEAILERD